MRTALGEAITALDLATMRDRRGGGNAPLDPAAQRAAVEVNLAAGETVTVWRGDTLAGYVSFVPKGDGLWFIPGIALHPALGKAGTMRRLRDGVAKFLRDNAVLRVESHVFKTNARSVALHRRLGFDVFRENDHGLAFTATAAQLLAQIERRSAGGAGAAQATSP